MRVATTLLPNAVVGRPYQAELIYYGGTDPVTWSVLGSMPDGLAVSDSGRVQGTPTSPGEYQLEARAEDAKGVVAGRDLTLLVLAGDAEPLPELAGSCDAPASLVLMSGFQTIRGRLPGTATSSAPCPSEGDVAMVVFEIELSEPTALRAAVVSSEDASIALLEDDDCAASAGSDQCTRTLALELDAGTHRLGFSGPPGAEIGVTVELLSAGTGLSDQGTCAAPTVVDLTSGNATLAGNFIEAHDAQTGSCNGPSFPEFVYALELHEASDLTISGSVSSALYLRSGDCARGSELGCGDFGDLYVPNLEAGTYFLFIESRTFASATFSVTVRATAPTPPAANSSCDTAELITVPIGGRHDLSASFRNVNQDPWGGSLCGSRDVGLYYRVELDAPSTLDVRHSNSGLAVGILRGDCTALEWLTCGGYDGICSPELPTGTYYLRLAPGDSDPGQAFLQISRGPSPSAPSNETCASATPLAPNTTTLVDLSNAANDFDIATCSAGEESEVFYSLDLAERSDVQLGFTGVLPQLRVAVLSDSCANPEVFLCENRPNDVRMYGVGPGRLNLVVERTNTDTAPLFACQDRWRPLGNLQVSVAPSAPVPVNNDCSTTSSVSFPQGTNSSETVVGTLMGALSDFEHVTCPSGSNPRSTPGGDVVYLIEVPSPGRLRVQMTPSSSDHLLSLLPVRCDNPVATACGERGLLETAGAIQAGQYWLRIDTKTRGRPVDYNLDVTLLAP